MRTESNERPSKRFILENYVDGFVDIVFYDNLLEKVREEIVEIGETKTVKYYEFDIYRTTRINRAGLREEIEKNYNMYLENAKKEEFETLAKKIRNQRDKILAETDKYILDDFPISKEQKEKYKSYRNDLRKVPEQQGFPYDVLWPEIKE